MINIKLRLEIILSSEPDGEEIPLLPIREEHVISFLACGRIEVCAVSLRGELQKFTSSNIVHVDDLGAALTYKLRYIERIGLIGDPVDLTPSGLRRAHAFLTSKTRHLASNVPARNL